MNLYSIFRCDGMVVKGAVLKRLVGVVCLQALVRKRREKASRR